MESYGATFEAKLRYVASSMIVTIPVKVVRELRLSLGDMVIIRLDEKDNQQLLKILSTRACTRNR